MGILGSAAGIGGIVSDMLFNYTKSQYEDKISELERLVAKLNVHLENLVSYKEQINSFWNDAQSAEVILLLDQTIRNVERDMQTARDLTEVFKQTVIAFDTSSERVQGFVDDAKGILSVVDALV